MGTGSGNGMDLIDSENVPTLLNFENNAKITELSCGENTAIFKDSNGKIYRTGLKLNYTPAAFIIQAEYKLGKITRLFCGRKHYTLLDGTRIFFNFQ